MSDDLISREALKEKLQARYDNGEEDFDKGYNIGLEAAIDLIDNALTVAERPQGEWIFRKGVTCGGYYKCNKCGEVERAEKNYCPNCGALMKGGAE